MYLHSHNRERSHPHPNCWLNQLIPNQPSSQFPVASSFSNYQPLGKSNKNRWGKRQVIKPNYICGLFKTGMKLNKYFVIDFDSTFTKVEAFDVLADISLKDHPEREHRRNQIIDITNKGMD